MRRTCSAVERRAASTRRPRRARRRGPRSRRGGTRRTRASGRWRAARSGASSTPATRLDVDPDLVEARLGHLRGHRALPDHACRGGAGRGRARVATRAGVRSTLVGRIASCASCALRDLVLYRRGSGERVRLAVLGLHQLGDLAERGVGDVHRVGPHVGDEPDGALARQVDALVEALGERHRPAGAEPELARGLLLQRRGRERRRRRALALLLLHLR